MQHPQGSQESRRSPATRHFLLAVFLIALGALALWWATSEVWVVSEVSLLGEGTQSSGIATRQEAIPGARLAPVAAAMPLLGVAGIAGVAGSRGRARVAIGALVVVAAFVAVLSTGSALVSLFTNPLSEPSAVVEGEVGTSASAVMDVASVAWVYPGIAMISGIAMGLGGAMVMVRGRSWPVLGSRYERNSPHLRHGGPRDDWDALDRGIDPSLDSSDVDNPTQHVDDSGN